MTEAGATFTALWDANPHTITFYAADNTTVYGVENVLYGDSVTANVPPIPPTLVGNIFNGWNTAADGTGNTPAFYSSMPDTDLVFYPTYVGESSVNYRLETFDMDTNGNYPTTPTSVANFTDGVVGQTRTINPNYTRIGFTPDLAMSTLTGTIAAGDPLALQLYYARNQYDVTTYTADGATLLNTYTAYYNGFSPAIADAPAIDGYEFTQWDDAAGAGGNVVTLPFIVGTSDVNLYANYSVLSFDAVFEAPAADVPYQEIIPVVFGDTITAPATVPVREGWTFNGWAADGSSVVITDFGTMTSAGAVFHAIWTRTGYTVTFLFNDRNAATGALEAATTEISSTVTTFGDPIAFPTAPTLSYYVFDGWFEGGVTQWAAGATMPAHDLILVARYERVQVMLIPIASSTTKIDRSDLVSANDINATVYRPQPVDTEWYIYGLERQTNFDDADLLASYIQVQGDGVISFTPILNQGIRQYGTGTLVTVTDRVTGDVVEEFIIVVYGDVTGDTRSDAADIAIIRQESMMASSWSVVGSPTYRKCLVMAADFSKDNKITVTDFAAIKDVVARIKDINQETGTTYLI